jgi:hypothetical protein
MAITVADPAESRDDDWMRVESIAGRNVGISLWRGFRGRCPRCGLGGLFVLFSKRMTAAVFAISILQDAGPAICSPIKR